MEKARFLLVRQASTGICYSKVQEDLLSFAPFGIKRQVPLCVGTP